MSTCLSVISQYQASIRHLALSTYIQSDFASRNDQHCQIVMFIRQTEDSVVQRISARYVTFGKVTLPFSIHSDAQCRQRTPRHSVNRTDNTMLRNETALIHNGPPRRHMNRYSSNVNDDLLSRYRTTIDVDS